MIVGQDQEAGKKLVFPLIKEYKIIILGDDSRGEKELKNYLDDMKIRNKCEFNVQIYKFDIDFGNEKKNDKQTEEFIDELINLLRILQNGVHLIMICFPITSPRAEINCAGQVYRLLGPECSDNLFAIITEYDKLNENYKYSKSKNMIDGLSSLMMKNVMPLSNENIILFDSSNSETFDKHILQKLNLLNNSEFKSFLDVNLIKEDMNSKISSLKELIKKKENFKRFLSKLTEIKEYIDKYKIKSFLNYYLNLNNYKNWKFLFLFLYSSLGLGLGIVIWKYQHKITSLI